MRSVPNFALYGTEAETGGGAAWTDGVHFERIPDRASLFGWEIEPHVHDALIQVLYAVRGSGTAVIDGTKWTLETPCLIVAPARSVHGFRFSTEVDGFVVTAAQRALESLVAVAAPALLAQVRAPGVLHVDPAGRHADALMPLFGAIEREASTYVPGQVAAGMALVVALFVQIARIALAGQSDAAADATARSRNAAQIERFRALLDERCRERLPVAHYARALGVTRGHLTRLCREVLGTSTQRAVDARVVHEAERELVYSSLSVKQVAAELGFDDEAYFGRFFKKHTGLRPTEFRDGARRRLAAA